MFRRPGDDNQTDFNDDLEQAVNSKLRELLAKKKEQDLEGASERTRGHATRVLRPRLSELREMVVYGLSMREMTDLLAEGGVQVNYHSLRAFLKKHLPREYAEYLLMKKPFDNPNHLGEPTSDDLIPPPELSHLKPGKNEASATTNTGQTGERSGSAAGKIDLERAATPRIDPAAIGLSSEERKAIADEEARRIEETYNKPHKPKK